MALLAHSALAIEYQYDAAGRLSQVQYDNGIVISYSYDDNGNLLQRDVSQQALVSDLSFSLAADQALETAGQIAVTVTRSQAGAGAVSVDYDFTDITSSNGLDYQGIPGTLNWPANDSTDRIIQVPLLDDALIEADETFSISLQNPIGSAQIGAIATLTVMILDDDTPLFADGFED